MSNSQQNKLVIPIISLIILYGISILFFHAVEHWSYLDAAYFTTTTISTVGYGDFVPQTAIGKIGTMVLIFSGISLAFYVITNLGSWREKTFDKKVHERLSILRNLTDSTYDPQQEEIKKRIKKRLNENTEKQSEEDVKEEETL